MTTISLGTSSSPCLKYFCRNLGRTKTGKKEMLFYQRVCSISPEQSPAEKQRGLHMKMGGAGGALSGKKCLSPNQGDGMASMRRMRFAVRMISGPESAFVERKCP